jgi:hypothetical protein
MRISAIGKGVGIKHTPEHRAKISETIRRNKELKNA